MYFWVTHLLLITGRCVCVCVCWLPVVINITCIVLQVLSLNNERMREGGGACFC